MNVDTFAACLGYLRQLSGVYASSEAQIFVDFPLRFSCFDSAMSPTCSLHEYRKKRDWLSEKLAETRALQTTDPAR